MEVTIRTSVEDTRELITVTTKDNVAIFLAPKEYTLDNAILYINHYQDNSMTISIQNLPEMICMDRLGDLWIGSISAFDKNILWEKK